MAHWNTTCGAANPVSEMLIRAGLRCVGGKERIRVRSARPRFQAVVEVNVEKRVVGEDSRVVRVGSCGGGGG